MQVMASVYANKVMAERVGFEPTLPFRVNTLSKRAPSATRPSLPTQYRCTLFSILWLGGMEPQAQTSAQNRGEKICREDYLQINLSCRLSRPVAGPESFRCPFR
jgi:hypothetical protein